MHVVGVQRAGPVVVITVLTLNIFIFIWQLLSRWALLNLCCVWSLMAGGQGVLGHGLPLLHVLTGPNRAACICQAIITNVGRTWWAWVSSLPSFWGHFVMVDMLHETPYYFLLTNVLINEWMNEWIPFINVLILLMTYMEVFLFAYTKNINQLSTLELGRKVFVIGVFGL